jgi:GT2 family glycosyltransferase
MKVSNIGVVIVTYGNRIHLLEKVIQKVQSFEEVRKIFLVNNNPTTILDAEKYIDIVMINNNDNLGSAVGYKQGIERAYNDTDIDFIWLLDDDNKPDFSSLDELQETISLIDKDNVHKTALLCIREDRKAYYYSAYDFGVKYLFPSKNSFLGLNIFEIAPKFFLKKYLQKIPVTKKRFVKVPVAPYGGLIFHKSLINSIGFPNEDLFLYSDDNEYSYRIIKNGGVIYLLPECRVEDIDNSWFIRKKGNYIDSLYDSKELFRIYYTLRNRVFTEKKYLVENKIVYQLNRFIYVTILLIYSIKYQDFQRFNFLRKAILDGDNKKLGKVNENYFYSKENKDLKC